MLVFQGRQQLLQVDGRAERLVYDLLLLLLRDLVDPVATRVGFVEVELAGAVQPEPVLAIGLGSSECSHTVLLSILPVACIDLVFFKPLVNTVSFFNVVLKLSNVSALFVDFELTETVHDASLPLSQVAAPVCPLVRADSVEGVVAHLPLVLASVLPTILAGAVLLPVEKRAHKTASI
jgi:hypothetical protein